MNCKKILALLAISFGTLINVGVGHAQTYYDFQFGNTYPNYGYTNYPFSGVIGVTNGFVTSITGTLYYMPSNLNGDVSPTTPLNPNTYNGNDNSFSFNGAHYLNQNGVAFSAVGHSWRLFYDSSISNYRLQNDTGMGQGGPLVVSITNSVAAPEIDGSLAPKVGFLLGCLFLMFGRKKSKYPKFSELSFKCN